MCESIVRPCSFCSSQNRFGERRKRNSDFIYPRVVAYGLHPGCISFSAMKTIIQSEAAECGLASLAMVADANGMKLGLAEMRRRFPLSLKGASLSRLMVVAGQLSFQCRPLRLDMEHLGELKLPCILHRDLNHSWS